MQVQSARWSDRLSSGCLTLQSRVGDHQRVGDPPDERNAIVGRGGGSGVWGCRVGPAMRGTSHAAQVWHQFMFRKVRT